VGIQGQIGGEQGLDGWGWFPLPSPFGCACGIPPEPHDADEAPRQHRVPQSAPGLSLSVSFCGMGGPTLGRLCQGLGRADQGAVFARRATALFRWRRWHRVEFGPGWKPPHAMGRRGKLPDSVLGRIAPIRQAPEVTPGPLLGDEIEDGTSQRTVGTIRHVEFVRLIGFERAVKSDRATARVAGPPRAGKAHDGPHAVHAPPRAVCLAG
jgi:hypothetical protein